MNTENKDLRQQWSEERAYRTGMILTPFCSVLALVAVVLNWNFGHMSEVLADVFLLSGCFLSFFLTRRQRPRRNFIWLPFYIGFFLATIPSVWLSGGVFSPWLSVYMGIMVIMGSAFQNRFNPLYNMLFVLFLLTVWLFVTKYFPYEHAFERMQNISPFFVAAASSICIVGIGYFMHELTRTEKDLSREIEKKYAELYEARATLVREESANQSKSAFLANISHELRTPLGAIVGYASILRDDKTSPEEKRVFADTIERNSQQLARLVDDLLDLSKIEAGRLEVENLECSPMAIVKEVTDLFSITAKSKNLQLSIETKNEIPKAVLTDPFRLKQILTNLVGNSLKFTTRGSVEVIVEFLSPSGLTISVKDTGRGIADVERDKLFKPFSQADASMTRVYGGTGLGLNFSRKLARLLGGDLELTYSALGVGSEFTLRIPVEVVPEHLLTKQNPEAPQIFEFKNLRILVVDDAMDNRRIVTRYLAPTGATVDEAADGVECVEMALRQPYDIIFMDLQMPRMDGLTATAQLRQHGFPGAIIALTAHAMKQDREFCLSVGCDAHMAKPLQRIDLLQMVSRFSKGRVAGQMEGRQRSDNSPA